MALVEFTNNQAPYLNAENLNNNFNELKNDCLDLDDGQNLINTKIGDMENLATDDKNNLVAAINSVNANIDKATILWTNSNPTSNFTPQNIILSSNDYDLLLWIFSTNTGNSAYISFFTVKGKGVYASWLYNNGFIAREITYTNATTYAVGNNLTNGNTGNNLTIPQYVIGFKFGLF